MQAWDRKINPSTDKIEFLLAFFWLLLILSNLAFAQEFSYDPNLTAERLPLNESTETLKPLWGGPTSFDPVSADPEHTANPRPLISLHHFDLACERCHDGGVLEGGSGFVVDRLNSDVDINMSCTFSGCHDYNPALNHPIDISPTGFVPEEMPLDSFGRITCLTCHDRRPSNSLSLSRDRPLQIPDGISFCSSCHSSMPGTSKEQAHWKFSSNAHLESIGPNTSLQSTHLSSGLLDPESQSCLSCHEGITATLSEETGISQHSNQWNQMANHPIGMDYSTVVSRNALRYNRLSRVNLDVRLFDGKMGCGSCHSLYSGLKKNLVQDNTGSRLCFECHNM